MPQSLADLQTFAIPGAVAIVAGDGGLPVVRIATPLCRGEIHLNGAHITRFQPAGQAEVLWMSTQSLFAPGKPIRGGVPICWPWFGPHASDKTLLGHGHARLRTWTLASIERLGDGSVRTVLTDAGGPLPGFPHDWSLRMTVTMSAALDIDLTTTNPGAAPFTISEALHSYFSVSDVRACRIEGLDGTVILDKAAGGVTRRQDGDVIFAGWTDQVHAKAKACWIRDAGLRRIIAIAKRGAASTVVWNPWTAQAAKMVDFADAEWPGMLCVEPGNCLDEAVVVAPGASHTCGMTVSVRPD
jgi:glucose-6-phosphate 1-epimerase